MLLWRSIAAAWTLAIMHQIRRSDVILNDNVQMRCLQCKTTYYCDPRECQKADWQLGHEPVLAVQLCHDALNRQSSCN
jgi:hypothetical protein